MDNTWTTRSTGHRFNGDQGPFMVSECTVKHKFGISVTSSVQPIAYLIVNDIGCRYGGCIEYAMGYCGTTVLAERDLWVWTTLFGREADLE